ncbi:MAG TPA: hypothetical protein VIN10_03110 [Bacteroidales bacterium]
MQTIPKIKMSKVYPFTLLLIYSSVLFLATTCQQYYQATSESKSEFRNDTVYNPSNLPGAERVIYGGGTASRVGNSGPIYLKPPLTKEQMDSLGREYSEWPRSEKYNWFNKNDSLKMIDTSNNAKGEDN